jgi:hypothetical protein
MWAQNAMPPPVSRMPAVAIDPTPCRKLQQEPHAQEEESLALR